MCTNSAIVESLECYLDDIVDCFEDFIKKSLIVITLAVGVVIGMLIFLLKSFTTPQSIATSPLTTQNSNTQFDRRQIINNTKEQEIARIRQEIIENSKNKAREINRLFTKEDTNNLSTALATENAKGNACSNAKTKVTCNNIDYSTNNNTKGGTNYNTEESKFEYQFNEDIRQKRGAESKIANNNTKKIEANSTDVKISSSSSSIKKTALATSKIDVASQCPNITCTNNPKIICSNNPGSQSRKPFSCPSCEELMSKDIGLNICSKNITTGKRCVPRQCSSSRLTVPSLPVCHPKRHLLTSGPCSGIGKRISCCSVCCDDDDDKEKE